MFEEVVTIYFHCIGFGCNTVYPWNSRSVVWTQTLHPPVHLQSGESMMKEFSFVDLLKPSLTNEMNMVQIVRLVPVEVNLRLRLTQAGGSIEVGLEASVTDTPSYGYHPFSLSIAVHARGRAPLWFTVGDTCPAHRHQGCGLCPRGSRWVRGQEEAGGWTAPVEDGHTHEGNTSSTVNNSQDKSATCVRR